LLVWGKLFGREEIGAGTGDDSRERLAAGGDRGDFNDWREGGVPLIVGSR